MMLGPIPLPSPLLGGFLLTLFVLFIVLGGETK